MTNRAACVNVPLPLASIFWPNPQRTCWII